MRSLSVAQVVGRLLIVLAFIFLGPALLAYYLSEDYIAFLEAFLLTFFLGVGLKVYSNKADMYFTHKEAFATVFISWGLLSVFGSLPYALTELGEDNFRFPDAMFETISGFTTTGSSVIQHIESMPKSLLLWRSMTQWIGGMGIIVLFLAILPMLGAGGFQLFRAEIPGPSKDKLSPKIKHTATYLWVLYIGLTGALMVLLYMTGDMSWFDSICHAFTTVSTGGYSTRDASVKAFDSWKVELLLIIFMFISSCNFGLLIHIMKGRGAQLLQNSELKTYLILIFGVLFITTVQHHIYVTPNSPWLESIRKTSFQIMTLISSTGFATDDFDLWPPICHVFILLIMISGGCAGSTSGGMKVFRLLVMMKVSLKEIKKIIHPRAIYNVKADKMELKDELILIILGFVILYFTFIFISVVLLLFIEGSRYSLLSLLAVSISCVSNIGPGLLEFGPTDNFYQFSDASKIWLSFLMLLGRLELYSGIVLFHPDFWRR